MSYELMEIIGEPGGTWVVKVDGRRKAEVATLDEALRFGSDLQFAPGELPGTWKVRVVEPKDT
jgi:hypothetical protein